MIQKVQGLATHKILDAEKTIGSYDGKINRKNSM